MSVDEDDVVFADGSPGIYGVVRRPDFAIIIPRDGGRLHLVEQYRYPVGNRYWEFPQGSWPGDRRGSPIEMARQELAEETGLNAASMIPIGWTHVAYGYSNQRCHIFLAEGLSQGHPRREASESNMRTGWVDRAGWKRMVAEGQIADAASLAAYALRTLYDQRTGPRSVRGARGGRRSGPRPERGPAHKFFVGGCALADRWMTVDRSIVDKEAVLRELGLQPGLPTFFHNARYALHHKGQLELMRAVDQVLSEGLEANFIIRCLSGSGIDNAYFHDVVARHAGRVHLEWEHVPEERILAYAASSDFCIFPSKFEPDTFLIAQGEAMACGAVPIAAAQLGMARYGHVADPTDGPDRDTATGLRRQPLLAEDDGALVAALADRFRRAATILVEQPDVYRRLLDNAVATARRFSWTRCTEQHLAAFQECFDGKPSVLLDDDALARGWFDLLSASAWRDRAAEIAERAVALANVDAYLRVADLSPSAAVRLFDAAHGQADFATCERVASMQPADAQPAGWDAVRERCAVTAVTGEQPGWRLR